MRRALVGPIAATLAATLAISNGAVYAKDKSGAVGLELVKDKVLASNGIVPKREEMEEKLAGTGGGKGKILDVLVIGGGATGTGVALDAVRLVERDDFSSGSSLRSTKLLHGGDDDKEFVMYNVWDYSGTFIIAPYKFTPCISAQVYPVT